MLAFSVAISVVGERHEQRRGRERAALSVMYFTKACTSGRFRESSFTYTKSGRPSGLYVLSCTVAALGATQPEPPSTSSAFSLSWFCS